jgi:peptidoglycan/LPS O-acetylase OafA/YrhL
MMTPRDASAAAGISSVGSSGYIPEVESLRGIAIALVFLSHANAWVLWRTPFVGELVSPLAAFMAAGYTGVSLFFVLSGFLLSRPFLKEAAGHGRVDRGAYVARRALRILPLYVVTVVVATLVTAQRITDLWRGVPYLFFLQGLPGCTVSLDPYPDGPWWSLATEVQFYLLLPMLALLLRRRRLAIGVLVAYVVAYAAFAGNVWQLSWLDARVKLAHSAFGRGPAFGLGIAAAWLYGAYGSRLRDWATASRRARFGAEAALALVLVVLAYLLRHVAAISYAHAELEQHAWHVLEALLWTSVLFLLLVAPLRSKMVFVNPAWEKLGLISYSVYLVHGPVLLYGLTALRGRFTNLLGWTGRSMIAVAVLALVCIAVSSLTYLVIERPFLRRKTRFGWWVRPPVPAAPARPALGEVEVNRAG